MHKKLVSSILAILSTSLILTGCAEKEDTYMYVSADKCIEHRIIKNVNISGFVEVDDEAVYTVSTKLKSYRVKSLNVRSGDEVKQGDLICEFDTNEIEKNIVAIEERIKNVQSYDEQTINGLNEKIRRLNELCQIKLNQLEEKKKTDQDKYNEAAENCSRARAELETAESDYNNAYNNLANASVENITYYSDICENLLDTIRIKRSEIEAYSSLMSDLSARIDDYPFQIDIVKLESEKEIADIQLSIDANKSDDELTEQLRVLKESLNDSVFYAPCSGIVKDVNVTIGQICSESSLVTIVQTDKKTIHAALNDSDAMLVKEGMKVNISFGQKIVEGEVVRINRIKSENGFDVFINISDPDNANIGMSVSNSIKVFDENLLSISRDAIVDDNGTSTVFVAVPQDDGSYIAEPRVVETGVQDDEYVEICSGISEGEYVIISNTDYIKEGMHINLMTPSGSE